jgi:DNA-directed RNA polymerase specialized sigma24 family protein
VSLRDWLKTGWVKQHQPSRQEIADLLGLRAGTVRAHLFRAVHKIRKELAGWMNRRQDDSDDDTD